jgi:hypothetical protein
MKYPGAFDALLFKSKEEFANAAPNVQTAYCIHRLFFNSSGAYVQETLQALTAIGAIATRALLERAIAIGFPDGYPADAQRHRQCLANFQDVGGALHPLDSEFFEYRDPLAKLVNDYLAGTH